MLATGTARFAYETRQTVVSVAAQPSLQSTQRQLVLRRNLRQWDFVVHVRASHAKTIQRLIALAFAELSQHGRPSAGRWTPRYLNR